MAEITMRRAKLRAHLFPIIAAVDRPGEIERDARRLGRGDRFQRALGRRDPPDPDRAAIAFCRKWPVAERDAVPCDLGRARPATALAAAPSRP